MCNKFILVINDAGEENMINVDHITHIKRVNADPQTGHLPAVLAGISGMDKRVYLMTGEDSKDYYDWLMEVLEVDSYWEYTDGKEELDQV